MERERISSAIDKVLAGKGVSEKVDGSLFYATLSVVVGNTAAQTVFGHWLVRVGWKQRLVWFSLAVCQILLQDGDHIRTKRQGLRTIVLDMTCEEHSVLQIQIPYPKTADRTGPTTSVEQEVDDYPRPIFGEIALFQIRLSEQLFQLCIGVRRFARFLSLVGFKGIAG